MDGKRMCARCQLQCNNNMPPVSRKVQAYKGTTRLESHSRDGGRHGRGAARCRVGGIAFARLCMCVGPCCYLLSSAVVVARARYSMLQATL